MRSLVLPLLLLAFAACTKPEPAVRSDAKPTAAISAAPQDTLPAPMTVRFAVQSSERKKLVIAARIQRSAPIKLPVNVRLIVPPGVTIASGLERQQLPASETLGVTQLEYVLTFDAIPAQDLVVIAQLRGHGVGVTAKDVYRFGRPAPAQPRPRPQGPDRKVGGFNFGPAIPAK